MALRKHKCVYLLFGIIGFTMTICTALSLSGALQNETVVIMMLKIGAVFTAYAGITELFRNIFRVPRFIAPAVSVSAMIVMLMIFGMLGFLFPCVCSLYAIGLLYWLYNAICGHRMPDYVLFIAGFAVLVYLFIRYRAAHLYSNDDMAHWALVSKLLLLNNRFPSAADNCVRFESYPLGSSVWIYFINRLFNFNDGLFLAAQDMLSIILLVPLFGFIRARKKVALPFAILFVVFLYRFNRNAISIKVDWLIGHYFASMLMVIYAEKNEPRKMIMYTSVMMLSITLFKNSCLFFVATGLFMMYTYLRKSGLTKKKAIVSLLTIALACLAFFVMWNVYVKLAYKGTSGGPHSVSASRIAGRLDEYSMGKSTAQVIRELMVHALTVAFLMFKKWFAFRWEEITLYSTIAVWICVMLYIRNTDKNKFLFMQKWLIAWIAMLLSWLVCLYGTYLVSMSPNEALSLASYERYISTVLIAFFCMMIIPVLSHFSDSCTYISVNGRRLLTSAMLLWMVTVPLVNGPEGYGAYFTSFGILSNDIKAERKAELEYKEALNLPYGAAYLHCCSKSNILDIRHDGAAIRYDFLTKDISILYYDEDDSTWMVYTASTGKHVYTPIDDPLAWMNENATAFAGIFIDESMKNADQLKVLIAEPLMLPV